MTSLFKPWTLVRLDKDHSYVVVVEDAAEKWILTWILTARTELAQKIADLHNEGEL
jgi:hypothetical protein